MGMGPQLSLVVLGTSCFLNALFCGFVFDDVPAIVNNPDVKLASSLRNVFANDFWGTAIHNEQSHKSYRPLTVLTFRLNFVLQSLEPFGYHLVNVLIHVLVCLLYHRVCLSLTHNAKASLVSAVLFAIHPVHVDAVTSVVGRAELLSALFYLSGILVYVRSSQLEKRFVWLVLLTILGSLCKEQCLTLPLLLIVFETINYSKSRSYIRMLLLSCTLVTALTVRLTLTGGATLPTFNRNDNPASVAPCPSRQLTYVHLAVRHAWLILNPFRLSSDWSGNSVPLVTSIWDLRNVASLVVFGSLAALGSADKKTKASLALTLVPFLPASNLAFPVGFSLAERVLYLPSMGVCLLVSLGWTRLRDK